MAGLSAVSCTLLRFFRSLPSDAVNFFKWFFLIFTSVQWIALVVWSLAVEKQEESGMKQMSWDSLVSKVKLRSTDVY